MFWEIIKEYVIQRQRTQFKHIILSTCCSDDLDMACCGQTWYKLFQHFATGLQANNFLQVVDDNLLQAVARTSLLHLFNKLLQTC